MSFRDVIFQRFDDFKFRLMRRQALTQPSARRVLNFSQPKPERKIPTFGADPSGFGEDWANYRLARPGVQGVVNPESPRPELENIHGFIDSNSERPIEPSEPYEDPSLSAPRKSSIVGTDQRPVGAGHDTSPMDKEIVLHTGSRKCLESDLGKNPKEPTFGDQAEKDLKHYPYDFSV